MHRTSAPASRLHQIPSSLKKKTEQDTAAVFRKILHSISPLLPLACPHQATSSAVPVMSQSEHQTPNTASLPACSATLSVIYNPKHSSALFASVNTDQSMPGRVSRPVVQERHASARITSPASLISHHWRPLTTLNTLPSAHTCCHPNTFPCCLSHDNTFPNAGEVALSGGV